MGKKGEESRVSERLEWLEGCRVRVRFSYVKTGHLSEEVFEAEYVDTLPMGREYFFVFVVDGSDKNRLIRTSSVIEIVEL